VCVTERDNMTEPFASEGVLSGQVSDPIANQPSYMIVRTPAFYALKALSAQLVARPLTQSPGLARASSAARAKRRRLPSRSRRLRASSTSRRLSRTGR
jgi:hypothetical protein